MLRRLPPIRALLIALAILLPLQLLAAPVHHKHEAQKEILALEQQWRQAQLDGDVAAMDKILSDDFLGINVSGEVVTKAQQLDRMRSRQLTITMLDISDVKIKLIGQIAIVTSMAKIASTGPGGPLNGSFRSTRVYQQLPSGIWKLTSFEATRVRPLPGTPEASSQLPLPPHK